MNPPVQRTAGPGSLAFASLSSRTLFFSLTLLLGAGIFAPLQSQISVALVCGTAACADANFDVPLRNHLTTTLGHTVTNFDDNDQTWSPTSYDVVVISESVGSSNTAWLKTQAVGIFTVEGANNDELEMGSGGDSSGGVDTQINITDNSHYITAVFPTGVRTVTTVTTNLGYMSGWANGVTKLAHYNSNSTLAKLLYVDNGGVLQGGVNTAAERRAFFAAQYFANLTADGITLFNRSLDWAAYNTADHVVVTATDGAATTGGTEVLSLQLVDDLGNPVSKALAVTGTVTGSATFTANDIGGTNGSNSLTGTLSASGSGSVTITDAVAETVTVTADATGDNQTAANVDATVIFSAAPAPATLLVRYWFDEAASGQGPTLLIDDRPSPLNLPITYDGTKPTYKEVSTGRGWESTTTANQGRASTLVDGTKIQTTLNGATAATIEIVVDLNAVNSSSSRLVHIGSGSESGYLTLSTPNLTTLYFYSLGGTLRGQWNPDFGAGRAVYHLVYDSGLATAGDRVKLYKDGTLVTKTGGTDPPLNEAISIPNGKYFVMANRESGSRSFDGSIYYAAIYDGALTASEVSTNAASLLASDDAGDSTAPAAVTDLATGTVTSASVQLSWTAPGDDGATGTATTYDVRYSTSTITAGNWASATQATGEPSPQVAGSAESFTVTGLSASTTYYFAIKTSDEVPNESAISNVPSAATSAPDATPPDPVSNLATGTVTTSSVQLSWTAPGDDGATGTATTYDVRYSTSPITAGNWASATQATGEPSPQVAGSAESFTVTGLSSGTVYYFAIKTSDEEPNESAISNVPSATTSFTGNNQTGFAWSDDVASFTSKGNDVTLDVVTGTTYILGIQVAMTAGAGGDWVLQVREDFAGSWLDVFALGVGDSQVWETYSTHTFSKTNGNVVTIAEFGHTTAPAGFTAVDGEFSDDNNGLTDTYTGTDIYTELQYAVRASGTVAGHTYEFRVQLDGFVLDQYGAYAIATAANAVTSAVAEISPNDVATNSTGNAFIYAILATMGGGDTGVDSVTITVPSSFGDPTVTDVLVGGTSVGYANNTVGKLISINLDNKLAVTDSIQVLFTADAPTAADAVGKDFTSTVDDKGTAVAAQNSTEGSADSEAGDANSWTVTTTDYVVAVTPDTTVVGRLPSNGTNYTVEFNVINNGGATEAYDLLTSQVPGTAITVVSITGTGVTQGADPDSARVSGVAAADTAIVTVTYSVADVAAGTADTLLFSARSVAIPAITDDGRLELTVARPNITTGKAVSPTGTQLPGTELTYTLTITNDGTDDATSVVVVDSLPVEIEFKVGSVVNNLPSGVTATVEYSNDGAGTWTYTPVSAGCGAPANFDSCVTHIRWTLDNDLSYVGPDNTGNVEFVTRIQ